MNEEVIDIAGELLIINKMTIERILKFENAAECLALYMLYYITCEMQQTNIIKANDSYVKKALHWGLTKIKQTKNTLQENGLIEIVQRREQGKIQGWYINVKYYVNEINKEEDGKIVSKRHFEHSKPQVVLTTGGERETNAYYNNNINAYYNIYNTHSDFSNAEVCDKEENYVDKDKSEEELQNNFELIWKEYPRKDGKARAFEGYKQWLRGKKIGKKRIKLDNYEMWEATKKYAELVEKEKREEKYIKMGSTFFTSTILDYIEEI